MIELQTHGLIDRQVVGIWDRHDSQCPSPVVGNHGHVGESLVAAVGILDGRPRAVGVAWLRDASKCHKYRKNSIDTI